MVLENYLVVVDMYSKRENEWYNSMHSIIKEDTIEDAVCRFEREVDNYKKIYEKYKNEYKILDEIEHASTFIMFSNKEIFCAKIIDNSVKIYNT